MLKIKNKTLFMKIFVRIYVLKYFFVKIRYGFTIA